MEQEDPQTLSALLDRAVEAFGDEPAIITHARTISYRELRDHSSAMAKGLLASGVGKGTRVAVLAGNTPFIIFSLFACWRVGALAPAISTLATPAELAYILRHCDAQTLLMGRRFAGRDYADIVAKALPSLAACDRRPFRLADAPFLRTVWSDDADGVAWAGSVEDLIQAGASDPALNDAFMAEVTSEVAASDEAVIIYTSGTTTTPKAVVHSQGPMVRKMRPLAELQGLERGDRIISLVPIFWVGGMNILLESIAVGSALVLPDGPTPRAAVDAFRAFGADGIYGWPIQKTPIREMLDAEGLDYSGTRGLRIDHLPDGTPMQLNHRPGSLGMTETFGPHGGGFDHGEVLPEERRGAFGPARFGFEQRVVDPDTGEVVAPGEVGELQVRGGSLMKGFYKVEPSQVFTSDGFYGTKDLVRFEPNGDMYLIGRTGDMLKTRGVNVSRLEVEVALRDLPGVAEAIVCGLNDAVMGQRVVAAVVPCPGATVSEATLVAGLKEKIAAYKVPTNILTIDRSDIIMSASGKVRLPEMGALIAGRLGLS